MSLEEDAAADGRMSRQKLQDRPERQALAGAGFADEAQHLARRHLERHAVDENVSADFDPQVLDGEERWRTGHEVHPRRPTSAATLLPSRLNPIPANTIAMPGKTDIHHAVVMKFLPSAISTPHSAVGGCAPSPR